MTIRQRLIERMVPGHEDRLRRLTEIGAPEVMLVRERELVEEARKGDFKAKRGEEFFDLEFTDWSPVKGRGGKVHHKITLTDGRVIGLFRGPWGQFFSEWKKAAA